MRHGRGVSLAVVFVLVGTAGLAAAARDIVDVRRPARKAPVVVTFQVDKAEE